MTIGDGVFWSTVIFITFASIVLVTKKRRWGIFFKGLIIFVALGLVVGAGAWLYSKYENRPQVMSSLNGISLGMLEVDVTLQKGKPDQIDERDTAPDGFRKLLVYKGTSDSYTYAILRGGKDSRVVTDICDTGGYGRVLGLGGYSSEKDVLEKLGQPTNVSISEQGTEKVYSYPQWNAAFELAKGTVTRVCVTNRSKMRFSVEYGDTQKAGDGK